MQSLTLSNKQEEKKLAPMEEVITFPPHILNIQNLMEEIFNEIRYHYCMQN